MTKATTWLFYSPWPLPWLRILAIALLTSLLIQVGLQIFGKEPTPTFAIAFILAMSVARNNKQPLEEYGTIWPLHAFCVLLGASFVIPASLIDILFGLDVAMSLAASAFISFFLSPFIWMSFMKNQNPPNRQSGTDSQEGQPR